MAFDFHESYQELNPDDRDHRFYADLAVATGSRTAIDLGCGTGNLARCLAGLGIDVIGVDPDPDMLRVARSGAALPPVAGQIEWKLGYSDALGAPNADLAVMAGHVAQVFRDDEAWMRALADLRRALRVGGTLAFESRNPAACEWEAWNHAATLRTIDSPEGTIEFWHETVSVALPLVTYDTFTRNQRTGDVRVDRDVLAFRDERGLRNSVEDAGFAADDVFGDWDRRPVGPNAAELIVIARRR